MTRTRKALSPLGLSRLRLADPGWTGLSRSERIASRRDADVDPNASDSEDEDDLPPRPRYEFAELSARIQEVIDEYEAVFPKLNWSSPQVCHSRSDRVRTEERTEPSGDDRMRLGWLRGRH